MQHVFDTLINSFINDGVGIAEDFLNKPLAAHLTLHLKKLFTENMLQAAGTGNNTLVEHDNLFRSDIIYWPDRKHNNQHENDFFDLMDQFVIYLNATCYTGITGYEFHYAIYEKGSFYKNIVTGFGTIAAGNTR